MAHIGAEGVKRSILKLKGEIDNEPEDAKGGLFSMKFMAKSIERRKKEAQEVCAHGNAILVS